MRLQIARAASASASPRRTKPPSRAATGHGQQEHRPPPDAGRQLALRARREDLDHVESRGVARTPKLAYAWSARRRKPHARPPWILSRLCHAAAGE